MPKNRKADFDELLVPDKIIIPDRSLSYKIQFASQDVEGYIQTKAIATNLKFIIYML